MIGLNINYIYNIYFYCIMNLELVNLEMIKKMNKYIIFILSIKI